jgi:hypothetical protein
MITLADINEAYRNGTPEQKREALLFLMKYPEFRQYLKRFTFDLMTPADFEMHKRIRGGFL